MVMIVLLNFNLLLGQKLFANTIGIANDNEEYNTTVLSFYGDRLFLCVSHMYVTFTLFLDY